MTDSVETRALLQAEMARLRCELEAEVDQVVEQTKELTDWRKLVRQHPWVTFGLAVAGGYLLVPKRSPVLRADAETLRELSRNGGLVLQPQATRRVAGTLLSNIANAAAGMAVRSLLNVAEHHLSRAVASNGAQRGSSSQEPPARPPATQGLRS